MVEGIDSIKLSLPGLENEEQNISFFEYLPYSDFKRWVPENSIYEEALCQIKALNRLHSIKALSFLSYIGPQPENRYFVEFHHSRLDHTLTAALIVEEILRQNGFPQDQINLGIIAAILHDIATPAYGDAAKQIDVENLHEEDYWWEVLDKKAKDFIKQFGTRQAINNIIKNRGILGKVLDISDRITYTMKDLNALQVEPPRLNQEPNFYLAEMNVIIANYPKIGNIYKEVGIDQKKQDVFFNNADHLNVFLSLRAHLHQKLYLHPVSQAKDLFVAKAISQVYLTNKDISLSPSKLREMIDYDLMHVLADHFGKSAVTMHPLLVNWNSEFEKFDSMNEAKIKENELRQKDNIVVVGIKECKGFDSGTNYKIANGYKYVKFKDYDPMAAARIEKIVQTTKGIFLFWADISKKTETDKLLTAVLQEK